ncbi:crotonobetainyl-CoA:carnitine CoA-transferase CaiB-like acyl-CoA transferase [Breoghania corrubedonensis]|uniref:Crotonobetainyl-CoA:carnitine CoA-transferase CaiB-like acyl-CoA transferase n=1 Tax=Breoghania corrubedonensis TaxID=665038 RepID=A0A2T5V1I6_9HYPH|nr:CaiB/BaiF CoA-transferase family protein [Breoghania corrubedonensis]PTW57617.1 crotonobetainyl-CoA:carnitine CoA-transferase CaiB-like acyl-CoA transferase [Breoghania corrubedonensis]
MTQSPSSDAPLKGVRVLELARILAGPWIGQTLADLGADVIKVESPDGDDTRGWGPPFVEGVDGADLGAAYFHSCNRGKRSITADFRTDEGRAIVRDLVRRSDVLVENFKVGGLKKYGLDYAVLKEVNPRLVYCSITGFGQDGPYAHRAGYDFMIQGMSSIMDLTGDPQGEPQKVGLAVCDIFTGLYGTIGILGALREREVSGLGQHIDMALMDASAAILANQAMNYLVSGTAPRRLGNAHPNIVPYQVFPASDGHLIVAVGNDGQYVRFCEVIGRPDLAEIAAYRTNAGRVKNREELVSELTPATSAFARDELLARLEAVGVPAGPINTVADVFSDRQVIHRGMKLELTSPQGDTVPSVRSPIRYSRSDMAMDRPSPRLGEHTAEILAEIGREPDGTKGG